MDLAEAGRAQLPEGFQNTPLKLCRRMIYSPRGYIPGREEPHDQFSRALLEFGTWETGSLNQFANLEGATSPLLDQAPAIQHIRNRRVPGVRGMRPSKIGERDPRW